MAVRGQFLLYRWSRLLNSWFQSVCVFEKGALIDMVSLERVSYIDHLSWLGTIWWGFLLYLHVPLCAIAYLTFV